MARLLPPLFLALLPVAAPVPRDVRPEFGSNGLLTRADLEKVRFDSRTLKDGEGGVLKQGCDDREEKEDAEKKGDGERPRNRFDVAVHMPWARFRQGEPVPAYFVLRNNRHTMLGLGSRLDFSEPIPVFHGGDASFDIRDRATGESVLAGLASATNCGGGYLVEVPADGYYVVRADLSRAAGKPLPPGEYEVDWRYGRTASAPVRFVVANANPTDPKPAPAAKRPALHFYHVEGDSDGEAHLGHVHPAAMASALAVGPEGAFVPDVHTIPAADRLVEAWVEWKPYRDGDRVAVTLRPVAPFEKVAFSDVPQLYLQIETPGEAGPETLAEEQAKQAADRRGEELVTPLTIEARLPIDWRGRVGVVGSARVAVLVTSKRLELPSGRAVQRIEEVRELVKRADPGTRPPVWAGVVRTESVELRFPPAPPPLSGITYVRLEDLPDGTSK